MAVESPELGSYDHLMSIYEQEIPVEVFEMDSLCAVLESWQATESFARAIVINQTNPPGTHSYRSSEGAGRYVDRFVEGSSVTAWLDSGASPRERAYRGESIEISHKRLSDSAGIGRRIIGAYEYSLRIPTVRTVDGLHVVNTGDLPPGSWYAHYDSGNESGVFDPDAEDGRTGGPHALLEVVRTAAHDLAQAGVFRRGVLLSGNGLKERSD